MLRVKDPKVSLEFYEDVGFNEFHMLHILMGRVTQIIGMELLSGIFF